MQSDRRHAGRVERHLQTGQHLRQRGVVLGLPSRSTRSREGAWTWPITVPSRPMIGIDQMNARTMRIAVLRRMASRSERYFISPSSESALPVRRNVIEQLAQPPQQITALQVEWARSSSPGQPLGVVNGLPAEGALGPSSDSPGQLPLTMDLELLDRQRGAARRRTRSHHMRRTKCPAVNRSRNGFRTMPDSMPPK